jgi:hypothetical protein
MKFSGFLNVVRLDDGMWEYRLGEKVHRDYSLRNLEFIVRMHGLKWGVLDEKLAEKSLKDDELVNTGFLNVYIQDNFGEDRWCYRGTDLKSMDLLVLRKRVLKENLEWKITNQELADKSLKRNSDNFNRGKVKIRDRQFSSHLKDEKEKALDLREEIRREKRTNITGFFRVNLIDDDYKWEYRTDKVVLKANDLDTLEKLVLDRKLEWRVLDSRLALISRKND